MSDNWQMPRRSEACATCARAFEVGQALQAFLFTTPEGYERRDYCLDCAPPEAAEAVGSWKSRRPEPPPKKIRPFDREAIYAFFERLEDSDEPEKAQFRFVLALLLWRKKALKFVQSEEQQGREFWRFVAPATGAEHNVIRPDLDEERVEQLSGQLERLLGGESAPLDLVVDAAAENADA